MAQLVAPNAQRDEDKLPTGYQGFVVAVTEKTLTIKPAGDYTIVTMRREPTGLVRRAVYVQDNAKPPRRFRFHEVVLFHEGLLPTFSGAISTPRGHRVADLKVGDFVSIECRRVDGVDYCLGMVIHRRKGGKIPPHAWDESHDTPHALHLRDQAEQDWEEKGIPIPKKYLDPQGRAPWTNPPYPPVAPLPRVK